MENMRKPLSIDIQEPHGGVYPEQAEIATLKPVFLVKVSFFPDIKGRRRNLCVVIYRSHPLSLN
jgi:hypothetical protein